MLSGKCTLAEAGDAPSQLAPEGEGGLPHTRDDEEHDAGESEGARGGHEGHPKERTPWTDAGDGELRPAHPRPLGLSGEVVEDQHPRAEDEEGDEDEEEAHVEGDGGGGHEHEEGE